MNTKNEERVVKAGERYRHFKGNIYEVIAIAIHTETEEKFVIYKNVNLEKVCARPYDMFISEVDHEKYPDVTQKYRFEKISG